MYSPQAKTLVVSTHRSSIKLGGSLSQEDGWSQGCSKVTLAVRPLQRLGLLLEGSLGLCAYVCMYCIIPVGDHEIQFLQVVCIVSP